MVIPFGPGGVRFPDDGASARGESRRARRGTAPAPESKSDTGESPDASRAERVKGAPSVQTDDGGRTRRQLDEAPLANVRPLPVPRDPKRESAASALPILRAAGRGLEEIARVLAREPEPSRARAAVDAVVGETTFAGASLLGGGKAPQIESVLAAAGLSGALPLDARVDALAGSVGAPPAAAPAADASPDAPPDAEDPAHALSRAAGEATRMQHALSETEIEVLRDLGARPRELPVDPDAVARQAASSVHRSIGYERAIELLLVR